MQRTIGTTLGVAVLAVAALTAAGCAAKTKFVSSWKEPSVQKGSVKKIFVVGVARDLAIRRTFEDGFKKALAPSKVAATPSYEWFPDPDLSKVDRDATAARLKDQGFTHVLVSRLVDQKTIETYVPPTVMYGGVGPAWPGYYGGWYPYMSTTYVASPGYVQSNEVFSIETNLYDLSKEGVAWSGMTETTLSGGREGEITDFINTIVYEMKAKQLI
jgi:hypothetical protein